MLLSLLLVLAAVGSAPALAASSAGEVVTHVQARFDETRDFTARVHQEMELVSAGRTITADGTVAFKKPGKMRWELANHEKQVIVADGATLWFYQPEEAQVLKAPFQSAFRSSTPISFLTGVGNIADDFDVTLEGEKENQFELGLLPKKGEGELGRLRLVVERTSYDIVGAEIRDPLGNITRLRFSDVKRNTGIEDGIFRFEAPPGVDVVDAPIAE
jgi:outer membrane lipoprotein carrier protein